MPLRILLLPRRQQRRQHSGKSQYRSNGQLCSCWQRCALSNSRGQQQQQFGITVERYIKRCCQSLVRTLEVCTTTL
jgi:hypothetical protein